MWNKTRANRLDSSGRREEALNLLPGLLENICRFWTALVPGSRNNSVTSAKLTTRDGVRNGVLLDDAGSGKPLEGTRMFGDDKCAGK
jgi:hypothetical protein